MHPTEPLDLALLRQLLPIFTLLLVTQSRAKNIPLFLLYHAIQRLMPSTFSSATSTLLLAYTSFFAAGGTNSIASIDLASAYNGISSFNAPAVGILIFVGNWAGPIWWTLYGACDVLEHATGDMTRPISGAESHGLKYDFQQLSAVGRRFAAHAAQLTLFSASSSTGVIAACTALRVHLFVWTVFSPKLLYAASWAVGWHLGVNILLCGLFVYTA